MAGNSAEVEDLDAEELALKADQLRNGLGFLPCSQQFWDKEYAGTTGKELFDWYQNYDGLKEILARELCADDALLCIGSGNSEVSERLYDDVKMPTDITNVDFSKASVQAMRERNIGRELMTWHHMDVKELDEQVCPDETFDIVFDKGCLDCMTAGEGSARNVDLVLHQVQRVLKPGGKYIMVTFGNPDTRNPYLDNPGYQWVDKDVVTLRKPVLHEETPRRGPDVDQTHYVYILTKDGGATGDGAK